MIEPSFEVLRTLERSSVFTPLGIRFWDAAQDTQVSDGLVVAAYPENSPDLITPAFRTASGIYAFRCLPGMCAIEYPVEEPPVIPSPAMQKTFIVRVIDSQRKFLPVVFGVDVPQRGIFPTATPVGSPVAHPPGFYLFSASTRAVSAGLAVMRGQLVIKDTMQAPASYAFLEVQDPLHQKWYGLADERGSVAAVFPYPRFAPVSSGGSPVGPADALDRQRWNLTVRIFHDPPALSFPRGSQLPDLRSILKQRQGSLWSELGVPTGQPVSQLTAELIFGRPVNLRTDSMSTLSISSAV